MNSVPLPKSENRLCIDPIHMEEKQKSALLPKIYFKIKYNLHVIHDIINKDGGDKMNNEEKIISMLEKIMEKQDEHSQILNKHSQILSDHSQKHEQHTTQFNEHAQILSALRTGQEHLKAQMDEMKITYAKEFGDLKEQVSQVSVNQDLLREDVWQNKVDTHRIKIHWA